MAKWTADQRRAITTTGRSVVVSAAAGSGKTQVLAARCERLILGTAGAAGCGAGGLLVVTFTNAAADAMRGRIAGRLRAAAERAASPAERARVEAELAQLPRAAVGTLGSFCARLVRANFHAADVDPAFAVLDADQSRLLKRRAAEAAIEAALAGGDGAGVSDLLDDLFDGDDAALAKAIVRLHDFRESLADPEAWGGGEAGWRDALVAEARRAAGDLAGDLAEARAAVAGAAGSKQLAKLAAFAACHCDWCDGLASALAAGDAAGMARVHAEYAAAKAEMGSMPSVRADVEGRDAVRDPLQRLRGRLDAKGELAPFCRWAPERWEAAVGSTRLPTRLLLALADDLRRNYDDAKRRARGLDFADLERVALRLLDDDDLAEQQRRWFAHVLVDESQDLNAVQDRLLGRLSRADNAFFVGDVKQSVYRFRLAEPKMFLDRLARSGGDEGPVRVDLQGNFRSRPRLLDAVNAAFSRLMGDADLLDVDYADRHALAAAASFAEVPGGFAGGPVEVHILDPRAEAEEVDDEDGDGDESERIEREAAFVARRLRQLLDEGRQVAGDDGTPRPMTFGDVAVLLRAQRHTSLRFAEALRRGGVPCRSETGVGFFTAVEVQDVLAVLRLVDNPRQDVPLAAALRSPFARLDDAADVLADVAVAARERGCRFCEAAADVPAARPLLEQIDRWRRRSRRLPLAEFVAEVARSTGYLAYVAGLENGPQREANVAELVRRARQFDAVGREGLGGFLRFLDDLDDAGEVGQPPPAGRGLADAVRVMSVHAAKGLEFPVVVLADCGKAHNTRDLGGTVLLDREVGLATLAVDRDRRVRYDSPQSLLAKTRLRRAAVAEELRVLYVATTRAREHLICVGHGGRNPDEQRARWREHAAATPFPPAAVLGAKSFLDWLGMSAEASPGHFDVHVHAAADFDAGRGGDARPLIPAAVRRLEPLADVPEHPEAAAALRRLSTGDPAPSASRVATVARFGGNATDTTSDLPRPAFLRGGDEAGDRLAATRALVGRIDWAAAGADDVARRADALVAVGVAGDYDADALAWFAGTDAAAALRRAERVERDLPVAVAGEPAGDAPLDRPVVRGRAALAGVSADAVVLVDFHDRGLADLAAAVASLAGRPTTAWAVDLAGRRESVVTPAGS